MLKTYRDLMVWKKSMEMVEAVYRLTRSFPGNEKYGLTSQIQRAAVSVPANIAEGYARAHRGEYLHSLSISRGSLAEVETLLTIAVRLKLTGRGSATGVWALAQDTGKMLNKLLASLRTASHPEP